METLSLQAFHANLHGGRILCQGPFPKGLYPPLWDSVQALREPFKKKILLSNAPFGIAKYVPLSYDTVFRVVDSSDWTLFLTYMTYAPKPLLVISEDLTIPDGLWSKLTRQITFVHVTSGAVLNARPYDTVFFAPMEDQAASYVDYVYKMIQSIYRASYGPKEHKEIIQELRVAAAGLAWSRVQEESSNGTLCWYDPVSSPTGEKMAPHQMAELLQIVSTHLKL